MLDFAVMLLIVLFTVTGLISGLLLQVLRLAAAVVAVVASLELAGPAMEAWPTVLENLSGARETLFPLVIFIVVYLVLALIARSVVGLLRSASTTMSAADRLLGGVAGALKGAVLAYFLLALVLSAEAASKMAVPWIDTERSIAATFVREYPIGGLAGELEKLKEWTGDTARDLGEGVREEAGELIDDIKKATDK